MLSIMNQGYFGVHGYWLVRFLMGITIDTHKIPQKHECLVTWAGGRRPKGLEREIKSSNTQDRVLWLLQLCESTYQPKYLPH